MKSALRGVKKASTIQFFTYLAAAGLTASDKVIASGVVLPTGEIYVLQSGVGSALDVDGVIFHELFHKGLQNNPRSSKSGLATARWWMDQAERNFLRFWRWPRPARQNLTSDSLPSTNNTSELKRGSKLKHQMRADNSL